MNKKWKIISKNKDGNIAQALFKNRGMTTKKQIDEFLNPPDPYSMKPSNLGIKKKEINKAIKRIKRAIKDKESIIIYGDYDADGITSTAILWETLHTLGAKVMPFIPNREKHGYGLNKKGIDDIINHQSLITSHQPLIITVDNGIVASEGVAYAQKKGIDVIITDHHQISKKLPLVQAIIHSTEIAGASVSWFLAKEIYQSFHKNLRGFKASNSLELACIGTITDMMPMLGANRSLVKYGLEELRKSKRSGIKALCRESGVLQNQITAYHIGFILGPRINAMGRLEDALESLRLLCTKKKDKADSLADKLGFVNRQRRQLTETTFNHAKASATRQLRNKNQKILLVSHKSYNQGIVGLVAGRLVEEFYRPTIVISKEKEFSRGSVRSVKNFNVFKFLTKFKNLFEDIGGHPMAAGFTIKTEKIKKLKGKIEKLAKKEIKDELLKPVINVDLEISFDNIDWSLLKEIEKFAPFGICNRRPLFVSRQVKVIESRAVGRERKHLKLKVGGLDAIAFNLGHFSSKLSPGKLIDICYNLEKNVWNGKESLQLMIKDIKPCKERKLDIK